MISRDTLSRVASWGESPHQYEFNALEFRKPGLLQIEDLPQIGPNLFATGPVLEYTLQSLTGRKAPSVSRLSGIQQQFGRKAQILVYQATTDEDQEVTFTVYLSRQPRGKPLATEAIRDFNNLLWLAERFEEKLKPEHLDKFSVVRPIVLASRVHKGLEYPFFTMPFVPLGELSLGAARTTSPQTGTFFVPYFQYAMAYTKEMQEKICKEQQAADVIRKEIVMGASPEAVNECPQTISYLKKLQDLLIGNMLVYAISGGKFPKEYMLNAGDWMGAIGKDQLILKLITVRGGFEEFSSDESFFERLKTHWEPLGPKNVRVCPFESIPAIKYSALLAQARSMLRC